MAWYREKHNEFTRDIPENINEIETSTDSQDNSSDNNFKNYFYCSNEHPIYYPEVFKSVAQVYFIRNLAVSVSNLKSYKFMPEYF